jgi:hypothetical protein
VKSPRQKINERGEKPGAGIILSKRKGGIYIALPLLPLLLALHHISSKYH